MFFLGLFVPRDIVNFHLLRFYQMTLHHKLRDSRFGQIRFEAFALSNIISSQPENDFAQPESKGYGFVHFETEEAANKAVEKVNGKLLKEKKVFVGRFKSRNERIREYGDRAKQFTNVFMKNMPQEWDEEKIKEIAGEFGSTLSISGNFSSFFIISDFVFYSPSRFQCTR